MTTAALEAQLENWAPGRSTRRGAALLFVCGLLAIVIFLGAVFARPFFALLAPLLVFGLLWIYLQARAVVRSTRAELVVADQDPRLTNIVAGVSRGLNVAEPELLIAPNGGPNALMCGWSRRPMLIVTRSLLDTYTRTELEAVLAYCMARVAVWGSLRPNLAAALGPFGARMGPLFGSDEDFATVAHTRYPPALVSALERAEPRSGRFAPLWMVADGPSHRAVSERVAELRDL